MKEQDKHENAAFLWELNQFLSAHPEMDKHIPTALRRLGEHIKADQVSIVDINHDMTFSITHQWSTDGEFSQQNPASPESVFMFNKKLEEMLGRSYYIDTQETDPKINQGLVNIINTLHAKRAIFLPMSLSSNLFSFLVFSIKSHKAWVPPIDFLINITTILSGILSRESTLNKMARHNSFYQDFVENRLDCILRLDKELHINFANNKFLKVIEKRAEEVNGIPFNRLIPETERYLSHIEDLINDPDGVVTFESPVIRESEVVYMEWNIYSVQIDRNSYEFHVVGHDVTIYREEALALNHILEELWAKTGEKGA